MKATEFLNHLVTSLLFLKVAAAFTKTTWDDFLIEVGEKLKDDDDLLEALAKFLAWTPIFTGEAVDLAEPPLPGCFEDRRVEFTDMRGYFQGQG